MTESYLLPRSITLTSFRNFLFTLQNSYVSDVELTLGADLVLNSTIEYFNNHVDY